MVEYALLLASTSFGGLAGKVRSLGVGRELARPRLRASRAGGASDRLLGLPLLGILRRGPWPAWSSISSRIPTGIGSGTSRAPPSLPASFPPSMTSSPASSPTPASAASSSTVRPCCSRTTSRVRPDQRVARRARWSRAGRLQVGPWYVLADELIPSGEIARAQPARSAAPTPSALAAGRDVLYSPDAFGHPAIWPALAAEFGIAVRRALAGSRRRGRARRATATAGTLPTAARSCCTTCRPTATRPVAGCVADPARLADAWARLRPVLWPAAPPRRTLAVTIGADHHAAPVGDRARARPARGARARGRRARLAAGRVSPRGGRRRPMAFPRCTASCAGPTATPGRSRAYTPPGHRSSAGMRRPSCRSSAWPSRLPRWPGPRARRPPPAARRDVARAGPVPVSRLDRRLHLGRGRAAGGGPARRRDAGGRRDRPREPRRPDRQRSRRRARPSRAHRPAAGALESRRAPRARGAWSSRT